VRRQEPAHARRIEHAGHSEHPLARQLRDAPRHFAHGVERVGDHDEDRVGRAGQNLAHDVGDDLFVGRDEIVAAHARLAADSGRDDDHSEPAVPSGIRPGDPRVEPLDGRGLHDVQRLALGNALQDVDERRRRARFSTIRWATVAPTLPAPTTVTFDLFRPDLIGRPDSKTRPSGPGRRPATMGT
jgi:hypothetical protein